MVQLLDLAHITLNVSTVLVHFICMLKNIRKFIQVLIVQYITVSLSVTDAGGV